ncbi:hypothetical protein [Kurthia sp. Dielmo]|uniref:hypothetical protein n=1 Tax=Kurthia sp. Dielmo TaxID=1033738 RepID=UPI001121FA44|nr:hypothetical protein [Kurthia sp. Dielmo]
MLRIVILEENYSKLNRIHTYLEKCIKENELSACLPLTTRKALSVEKYTELHSIDCFYISMDATAYNPISLAKNIHQKNPKIQIIFLSEFSVVLEEIESNLEFNYQTQKVDKILRFQEDLVQNFLSIYHSKFKKRIRLHNF